MEIGDIISKSFKYPLNNGTQFMKVAVLYLLLIVPVFFSVLMIIFANSSAILVSAIITIICYLIFSLIMGGYFLSVMKEGISSSNLMPEYDFAKNIVDSIKVWVLGLLFSLIPGIIIGILLLIVTKFASSETVFGGIICIAFIALILEIIFCMFLSISLLRLANYDSLSEALNFSAIKEDLRAIGIGNLIVLLVVLGIISGAILFITGFLIFIPIVGTIIYIMFIVPYTYLAVCYGLGLMYSEIV